MRGKRAGLSVYRNTSPGTSRRCCLFSPYSNVNVRDMGVRAALRSPLFVALRDGGVLDDDPIGGCALYEKREVAERILTGGRI